MNFQREYTYNQHICINKQYPEDCCIPLAVTISSQVTSILCDSNVPLLELCTNGAWYMLLWVWFIKLYDIYLVRVNQIAVSTYFTELSKQSFYFISILLYLKLILGYHISQVNFFLHKLFPLHLLNTPFFYTGL